MEVPTGSAIMTPDQMWTVLQQVRDGVLDLQATVKPALGEFKDDVRVLDHREEAHHADHEARIRSLESTSSAQSWLPRAAWNVGSGFIGVVGTIIVTLLINHT